MTLSPVVKTGILVFVGVCFATVGLLAYFLFPDAFKTEVKKRLVLSPTSETYEQWKQPSIPIYLNVYLFNITNPVEIYDGKSNPVVEELGPYTFREIRWKENITWHENGTVSYRLHKKYYFQPDLTNGSLDDPIVTVNVPLLTIVSMVKKMNASDFILFVSEMLHYTNSSLFLKKNASELLFDGYRDPALSIVQQMFPEKVASEYFGWFYQKNDTSDRHLYTIFTGEKDINKFGYMDNWNGNNNVSLWNGSCSKIHGSPGEMWPPFRENRYERLNMFLPDICRSLSLRYLGDDEVKGVEAYRYWLDNTAFDNGKFTTDNKCFCIDKKNCLPAGGHDVSSCQRGAPLVISAPHFLYADNEYTENLSGLYPNPEKHVFYIDLQPSMGLPVNVAAKLQINAIVEPMEGVLALLSVKKKMYYPILWFGQRAQATDAIIKKIQLVTEDVPYYVTIGSFLLVIVGGVFLMLAIIFAVRFMRTKKEKKGIYTAVRVIKS